MWFKGDVLHFNTAPEQEQLHTLSPLTHWKKTTCPYSFTIMWVADSEPLGKAFLAIAL